MRKKHIIITSAAFSVLALIIGYKIDLLDRSVTPLVNSVKMSNVIHVSCRFLNAGVLSNSEDQHGISYIIGDLLFRRLENFSPKNTVEKMQELGLSSISVDATGDDFLITFCVLKQYAKEALKFLSKAFTDPKFTINDLEYVKCYTPATLSIDTSPPSNLLTEKLLEMSYGNHNYGKNNTGTSHVVLKTTINDIKSYMKQYFVRRNVEITFTGDLSKTDTFLYTRYFLGDMPKGAKSHVNFVVPNSNSGTKCESINKTNMQDVVGIAFCFRIDNPSDKELAAMLILMNCLFKRELANKCADLAYKTEITHLKKKYSSLFAVLTFIEKKDFSNYCACIKQIINTVVIPKDLFEASKTFFIEQLKIGITDLYNIDDELEQNKYPFEKVSYEFTKATFSKILPTIKFAIIGDTADIDETTMIFDSL